MNEPRIAGALYDFMGCLTTGATIRVGSSHNAVPLMEAFRAWAEKRGLNIEEADVEGWHEAVDHD